ncbi:3' terminal RNA ribose 2'-O-methyltransferase Hen1 [Solirubrobacter taibaiensis]|nr:3' terminal RNA ribose 2'-O-methyltransferase Hen1 [Solirubrobacter taibaiensis]
MLLSLSTTHRPATDLGFLLHKHPERAQTFTLPFGTAHVLYPEASEARCTAVLLLDIDPVGLTRRGGRSPFALAEYVNDRPYVASSLMSVALVTVFKTAMEGKVPELAQTPIPLTAELPAVPARGGEELVRKLFEPLGYDVTVRDIGSRRHVGLTLVATTRLSELLRHLYVLLPVLDDEKHYWVDTAEIEKLMRRGEGWLPEHPERALITRRYLKHEWRLVNPALAALGELEPADDRTEIALERPVSLKDQRLGMVQAVLKASGARSVIDLGCGAGALLERLLKDGYTDLAGADVSARALSIAERRLKSDSVKLLHSPLTYRDKRFAQYDAAALVEVIEHFDPPRLRAVEENVFGNAQPKTVVVTTPNAEYNHLWPSLEGFRHHDHRFEWTRAEFAAWAAHVTTTYDGYRARFVPVGPEDPEAGPPTQMAVFER